MIEIKITKNAVEGQHCIITCETETIDSGVSFQHPPQITAGSCPFPGKTCIHGYYNLTQKPAKGITTLTISSYSKPRDDGAWLCSYRGNSSKLLNLSASSKWSINTT